MNSNNNIHLPWWLRLLRGYGRYFPVLRGKSRVTRWAFSRLPKLNEPIRTVIQRNIRVELWPWLWSDFCTYVMGSPEPYHLAYFVSRVGEETVVFDVGAYIGVYALTAAQIARAGQVHAFEPDPRSARRLRAAITDNGIHNVHLQMCAVGDRTGERKMLLLDYPPMSSLQLEADSSANVEIGTSQDKRITVPVCTLDEYCEARGIRRVDLLKIDVEGAEMLVLRGAARLIASSRPEMLIELHQAQAHAFGHPVEEVIDHLQALGYQLFRILPGMRRPRLAPLDPAVLAHTAREIVVARPT